MSDQKLEILITGGAGNIATIINLRLQSKYNITAATREQLDMLNLDKMRKYFNSHTYDIIIHTAITGGRRTVEDTADVFYKNILMFENLLTFSDRVKMIINIDSGAIYDRKTDIMFRKEYDLKTVPTDYYGLSKYVIHKRSEQLHNVFHLRVFNIFHVTEEPDRFISKCFLSKSLKQPLIIQEDKYFDFFYDADFVKIVQHYCESLKKDEMNRLPRTVNLGYKEKRKLSDVAKMIISDPYLIKVGEHVSSNNYMGDSVLLYTLGITFDGLEKGLEMYKKKYGAL
jgi:nucleoside-diphosphate-sugar epimerase